MILKEIKYRENLSKTITRKIALQNSIKIVVKKTKKRYNYIY